MSIRVLLADDHAAIRSGLRLMLESGGGIEVVAEAADGAAAVTNARALRPDVVLMDLRMPGTDGITATRQIVDEGLAQVLVLTTYDLDEYVFGALRAGAVGFLLKTVEADALVDAVRRVAAGEGVIAPEVTRRLLHAFVSVEPPSEPEPPPWLAELSARELEVLTYLAQGRSNAEIGQQLTISEGTTKSHVSRVLGKLGCTSRLQAGILAREAGLGTE
ncbi:response regulator transcription factor [Ornithinicoccus hortensis]|uniref:LuxR family two component transcriptional regulator n=2 Tax=Ornithinicoccus hortensis TaxID=82346 RepID=A0A542YN60_9MICO|nr:response regulator transcription factor [Ornithinicoccus hortensis]TQL49536.1 LuxR family two component transcriptional regulator [Ornithinicoccus hortensis]